MEEEKRIDNNSNDISDDENNNLTDSISLHKIINPVLTANGSVYDASTITVWLRNKNTDAVLVGEKLVTKQLLEISLFDCKYMSKNHLRQLTIGYWNKFIEDKEYIPKIISEENSYENGKTIFLDKIFVNQKFPKLDNIIFKDCIFYGNCEFSDVSDCYFYDVEYGKIKDPFRFFVAINITGTVKTSVFKTNDKRFSSNDISKAEMQYTFYQEKLEYVMNSDIPNKEEYIELLLSNDDISKHISIKKESMFESSLIGNNIYDDFEIYNSKILDHSMDLEEEEFISGIENKRNMEADLAYVIVSAYIRDKSEFAKKIMDKCKKINECNIEILENYVSQLSDEYSNVEFSNL